MVVRMLQVVRRSRTSRALWRGRRRWVQAAETDLTPGVWLACDERFRVWRHWTQRMPEHLVESRIREDAAEGTRVPDVIRLFRLGLHHLLAGGIGLLRVRSPGRYSIAVTSAEGTLILLDPGSGTVKRFADRPIYTPEYVALRSALAAHVSCPAFSVDNDGAALTEEFVHGTVYETMGDADKEETTRVLLRGFVDLVADQRVWNSADMLIRARVAFTGRDLPETLRMDPWFGRMRERSMHWPLVPSHGDLHPGNVIVRDGRPVLIDLAGIEEPLGLCLSMRPFWYDAITVITSPAVPDLFQAFLAGRFDDEFTALYAKAGCVYDPEEIVDTLRTWVLLHAFEEQAQRGPDADDRLTKAALRHWDRIAAGLSAASSRRGWDSARR